jgi:hypothetical protein
VKKHDSSPAVPFPNVRADDTLGYVVLCWNGRPGRWANDWDGEVHRTVDAAREQLSECAARGFPCVLGAVVLRADSVAGAS